MKPALTPRQARFVQEYLIDLNGTAAAIRAGYAPASAHVQASRLLSKDKVAAAINSAKAKRSEETKIDAAWVLAECRRLYERCMNEIRPALTPAGIQRTDPETGEKLFTFNAGVAARALELIGKHTDIQAWRENITIDGNLTMIAALQAGRARAGLDRLTGKRLPLTIEHRPAVPQPSANEYQDVVVLTEAPSAPARTPEPVPGAGPGKPSAEAEALAKLPGIHAR